MRPSITESSLALFVEFANDACNWNGTPLIGGNILVSKAGRGNLTQLKKEGLVKTFVEGGDTWLEFTPAGIILAAEHGIKI